MLLKTKHLDWSRSITKRKCSFLGFCISTDVNVRHLVPATTLMLTFKLRKGADVPLYRCGVDLRELV